MRRGFKVITCTGWPDFKRKVIDQRYPEGKFARGRFLFRGQGGADWELSSAFDRWYRGDPAKKNGVADDLLKLFSKECELEDIPSEVRNDPIKMLSLGQHHGLPTRLLDWSESPYVAAFFAFSGHVRHGVNLEKYVAVWALDADSHIWNRENGCEIVNVPSFGNERIRNQHGRFTYLRGPFDCLEEYVGRFREEALRKYLIPVGDCVPAICDLDAMGVNHARIFPDLGGNAKAAEVRMILNLKSA